MKQLKPLLPGFYVDQIDHCIYLNMREFLGSHELADSPKGREIVWEEVRAAFGSNEVKEISDYDLLFRSEIVGDKK